MSDLALMERHLADSQRYQALLYHAWKTIRAQNKGLNRQARRVKRLQAELEIWRKEVRDLTEALKSR